MKNGGLSPARIALAGVLIALTTVFTLLVRVPVPATNGYINLSDVAIVFIGLIFGPMMGMVAGGVGAALADLLGGYPQFALVSLVAHGLEGFLVGLIGGRRQSVPLMLLAWLLGSIAVVGVYFVAEGLFLTNWPAAAAELPFNVLQVAVGAIGIPLAIAVRRAYPPIDQVGLPRVWHEEQ